MLYFCAAMIYDAGFLGIDPDLLSSTSLTAEEKEAAKKDETATKKLSYKEQKEFEQLDAEIPKLEEEQKILSEQMSSTDYDVVKKAGDRYNEIEKLLEEKYARWEELSSRI